MGRIVYVAPSRDEVSRAFGLSVVTNTQPISGQSAWQPGGALLDRIARDEDPVKATVVRHHFSSPTSREIETLGPVRARTDHVRESSSNSRFPAADCHLDRRDVHAGCLTVRAIAA